MTKKIEKRMTTDRHWPKRLYALDISRAFGALAVALWHWKHFFYQNNELPKDFSKESQPLYGVLKLFYEKGDLGVEYFFLLSGFIFFLALSRCNQAQIRLCLEFCYWAFLAPLSFASTESPFGGFTTSLLLRARRQSLYLSL